MKRFITLSVLVFGVLLVACQPVVAITATSAPSEPPATVEIMPDSGTQPVILSGSFTYSNNIITTYYSEQMVALVDMYGFVTRDREWEIPVEAQTLGFMKLDMEAKTGEYTLQLPARPTGTLADVDNNGAQDAGVQIFAMSYWPNLTGGPYSEGDDRSKGWPSYLASVKTDSENQDEVLGGKLVIWAPDGSQSFPTGFGSDGLLFTDDDPAGPVPAGYSVVDLDGQPFGISQEENEALTLFEPKDAAIKDFSADSYIVAFDKMFEIVRKEYAFNGIQGKQPDWDTLYAEIKPRVEEAEAKSDPNAYYLALRDFTRAFKDGHVGFGGGDYYNQDFSTNYGGGYGFAQRQLDDGRVLVVYVLPDGPADKLGMKVGAEILEFNGKPTKDAIAAIIPPTLPQSTDFSIDYQKVRYLLRTPLGTEATIRFSNPTEEAQTIKLTSVAENESHRYTSIYKDFDYNALPVEYKLLDSGVGYVRINSNYDDLGLIIKLFERALKIFQANEVPGIVIDLRQNSGGAPLGLAGFLTNQEIPMGQMEYFSEQTGKFEPEGLREKVTANENQYRFDKMVLMVDQACASACEIEAYAFSQVPGMVVVGQYPSAGVEAEVARGQFSLPEGFSLQIPTGRMTLPDGSLFLEGVGVQPTLRVAIDENFVLSNEDEILKAAERAVLLPLGAGIVPSGPPKVDGSDKALASAQDGTDMLEDAAREEYSTDELTKMDTTFPFTIVLNQSKSLIWAYGWCAKDDATLKSNFENIDLKFVLDGQSVAVKDFYSFDFPSQDGQSCRYYLAELSAWPAGEHHLSTSVTFKAAINDGTLEYPAGTQVFEYAVYIKP